MRLKLILLAVFIALNLLAYVPAPQDADGEAMLAVAANLVRHGRADADLVGAADWLLLPRGKMGSFGVDGALYAKKGITPTLAMMPLVWVADRLDVSARATAALLNVLVTAITAVMLFTFARWLGYGNRMAVALALIFNAATMAITYVKTLFGEPLAALLLLVAVMWAWRYRHDGGWQAALIAGITAALLLGINLVYGLLIGLVIAYAVLPNPFSTLPRIKGVAALVMPTGITLLLIGGYNLARFGNLFTSGYQFEAGEGFTYPLIEGLYGLILSPYRGLLWYNPVLLLAIPGWFLFRRRLPALAWLILALTAAQALMFASWWSWYGGIVWGSRFLLPAVPLLLLLILPVLEWVLVKGRRWQFVAVGVLVGISSLIQVLGVALSYLPYNGYLIAVFKEPIPKSVISDPLLSPIVGHLALLVNGYPLEPAWLAGYVDAQAQMAQELNDALHPSSVIVVTSTLFGSSLVDVNSGRVISMNAPTAADDPRARQVWEYALKQDDQLWLVTWFPPGAAENWQERSLWSRYSFVKQVNAAGHRAVLFDLVNSPNPDVQDDAIFANGIRLRRYGVRVAQSAGKVYVTLVWSSPRLLGDNYGWFVHVLDDAGNIIVQQDRQPMGGYAPTVTWQPGQEFTDRLMLPIDPAVRPAAMRLGWVDPASGQPLSVAGSTEPFVRIPLN